MIGYSHQIILCSNGNKQMIGSRYKRDEFSEISPQGWMEQDTVKYIECMILLYS